MAKHRLAGVVLVAVIGFGVVACRSDSRDVPSLDREGAGRAEPTEETTDTNVDVEAKMLAFTQCMRDQGIELLDPTVDSEGNVLRPALAEGGQVSRERFGEAYEACAEHLEGVTFGGEREDKTERVDELVALATCLRKEGYDVDDPTVETLDQWGVDFRVEFDWDDSDAKAAYDECSGAE